MHQMLSHQSYFSTIASIDTCGESNAEKQPTGHAAEKKRLRWEAAFRGGTSGQNV
jgi:hypothetical protein